MLSVDVIFCDVDGTLVDSRDDIANGMNLTLRRLGLKEKPKDLIVSYIGTGVKDLVRKSVETGDEAIVQEALEIFSDHYSKHPNDESRLYPHVEDILSYYRNKRKFILTNRYARFADITLRAFGIRGYFEDILGGDDEDCLKPSACVLDRYFSHLKLDRARSIIVGDMAIDIMTGRNSNVRTCWVTYGLGKRPEVLPIGPDYIIDDLIELKTILE